MGVVERKSLLFAVLFRFQAEDGIRDAHYGREFRRVLFRSWTAIAAKSYAPELGLVGTAAAAPPTDLADNMRKASEPNVRALLMGFTMYSWSQRFGYSMDGVVGKTNQDVTRKLAQTNCLSLAPRPRLGTIMGIFKSDERRVGKEGVS